MRLSVERGGARIAVDELGDDALDGLLRAVVADLRTRLAGVACDAHGQAPHVILLEPTWRGFGLTVEGCCPAVAEQVRSRL